MKCLDNVERIRAPSREVLFEQYVRPGRPVILTGLFDGQPVRALESVEAARELLGPEPVRLSERQLVAARRALDAASAGTPPAEPTPPPCLTVGDYLDLLGDEPRTPWVMNELSTPTSLRERIQLPDLFAPPPGHPAAEYYLRSFAHLHNAGSATDLHFDSDGRQVFMLQVFGRKRYILFPPSAGPKLHPVANYGTALLARFPEEEKLAFLRFAGAWDCVLEPGETLLMPAFVWHHVEYLDLSLSVNFRLADHGGMARYLLRHLHWDVYSQNVTAALLYEEPGRSRHDALFQELRRACEARHASPLERYRHIQALLRDVAARLCPGAVDTDYFLSTLGPLAPWVPQLYRVYAGAPSTAAMTEALPPDAGWLQAA